MRALWPDRQNCSHNVSQKVTRIRRLSEPRQFHARNDFDKNGIALAPETPFTLTPISLLTVMDVHALGSWMSALTFFGLPQMGV